MVVGDAFEEHTSADGGCILQDLGLSLQEIVIDHSTTRFRTCLIREGLCRLIQLPVLSTSSRRPVRCAANLPHGAEFPSLQLSGPDHLPYVVEVVTADISGLVYGKPFFEHSGIVQR
jgi:hypothetical protein